MSVLLVPVDGSAELFLYKVDLTEQLTRRGVPHLVSVDLNKDGVRMGRVVFSLDPLPRNERATEWTGLLCGSYVAVNGLAAFEVDERTGYDMLYERLRERKNDEPRTTGPDAPRTLRKARGGSGV